MSNATSILEKIDKKELTQLAVDLSSIYSPPGNEGAVGDFVYEWLKKNEFQEVEKIGMVPERFNVVGRLKGSGNGYSLIFNSHIDQAVSKDDQLTYADPTKRIYHEAWLEGDKAFGYGVVNDKGPMATFLIAAKAIKDSGIKLRGDLLVSASPGEIGQEPVDEFQGVNYHGKELGARYLATHGAVADYAIVSECTSFCPVWVEAGKAFFKITVFGGPSVYTPFLKRPTTLENSVSAIPRMAKLIEEIENWGYEYEKKMTRDYPGGTVVPKVNIGAIRSGLPYKLARTSELCNVYLDVRLLPEEGPIVVQIELQNLLKKAGVPGEVKLILFRRGYEAKNIDRALASLNKAHVQVLGKTPGRAIPPYSSMWRDINAFNEMGIPALTYGPTAGSMYEEKFYVTENDLLACAKVFAMTAFDLCTQERQ